MQIKITKEMDGMLLRDLLTRDLKLSAKMIKYLKYRNEGILVNGEHKTVRYVLCENDTVTLETEDRTSGHAAAVELPLEILYEDGDIVVPSKPADMPTHPSHDHYSDTVANALAYRYGQMGIPFVFRPINRLDRNTSGLLLIARNKTAAGRLTVSMRSGAIRKSYLAVLTGEMRKACGVIDAPLHRTEKSIILREVCAPDAPDADAARTEYTVLSVGNGHTLVMAHPITGRTHQLRVHFAHIGHPLLGDDLYGVPTPLISRHALHAYTLTFPHPENGRPITLTAPPPTDFCALFSLFPKLSPDCFSGKETL